MLPSAPGCTRRSFCRKRCSCASSPGTYDAIDHHADRCFRNQVVWRKEWRERFVGGPLQSAGCGAAAHPHTVRERKQPLPETVATTVKALFDEIYKEERLGHVERELTQVGKPSRLRATGGYVFRCEMLELPATRNRPAKTVPKFTIVLGGVDLGSTWSCLVGLGHLHLLIRQPGKLIAVGEFSRAERSDAAKGYKFRQEGGRRRQETRTTTSRRSSETPRTSVPRPSPKFAKYSTKELRQSRKAAELKLERARFRVGTYL